jgi:outer membrane lipoprotein-sorting protein
MTRAGGYGARIIAAALPLLGAACAPSLTKLPAGPGTPASDAADALTDATAACSAVSTISAEVGVGGSVGGRRVRGRLLAGLATPASVRLEAVAPVGQPIFILVATGDDATLLLPRDERVLPHGQPSAVLEAVAGVPLDPIDLKATLTGCSLPGTTDGRQFGNDWRAVTAGSSDVYLRRHPRDGRWQLVAAVHHAASPADRNWRAEYADFENGLPRSVRLTSVPDNRFDLRLTLSQVELNARLGPEVFRVEIPPGVEPITLEELRQSGPLGSGGAGRAGGAGRPEGSGGSGGSGR